MANGNFGGGNGTRSFPYLVEDVQDLIAVRNGLDNTHYRQVADINLNSINWIPIGDYDSPFINSSYDGNNHTIYNLRMLYSVHPMDYGIEHFGLFGRAENSIFKNINLVNVDINLEVHTDRFGVGSSVSTRVRCGSLLGSGRLSITINNCSIQEANIRVIQTEDSESSSIAGSLAGDIPYPFFSKNQVRNFYIEVKGYDDIVGGCIGQVSPGNPVNTYSIENCYVSEGMVIGNERTGGFIGVAFGRTSGILNCYSAVKVSYVPSTTYPFVGGFVGYGGDYAQGIYFDRELSTVSDLVAVPKSTEEMKKQETFHNWDFRSLWKIHEDIDYPRFRTRVDEYKCKSTPVPLTMRKMVVN